MQKYDSYKDSGIQWLGEIPSHWKLRKMKYTFSERSQKGFPNEPLLAATQNHGVIKKSDYENRTVEAMKNLDTLKLVEEGDFVISLRSFQGGIEYSYCRGIISPAYTVLKAHHLTESYFKHLAKSPIFIDLLKSTVTGIREGQNIDYNKLRVEFLPIPPIEEQQAIASYLDTATAKIDEAIAQQQKMIDLLNERKQIIINNAVTKGLNPNAKMKPSGIQWLGEIPSHWEVAPLKYCMKLNNGRDYKEYESNNGIPVIGTGGQFAYSDKEMFNGEVVFFGRKGTIDKPFHYKGAFWAVDTVFYAEAKSNMICRYLYYLGTTIPYGLYSTSTAIPSMTQTDLLNNPISLPPLSEQQAIASYLDTATAQIDQAIAQQQKMTKLLQERKQIIINDVVTGKVKVV